MPLPRILKRTSGENPVFTLFLEPDQMVFRGHFPGNPILPGVVQVEWAIRLGAEAFGSLGAFLGLERLKFQEITRPGETLELRLALDTTPKGRRLRFRFMGASGPKSSGIALFEALP